MQAINYLLDFAFDAIITILVIRVWLQLVRADFYNPLCQFIVKVSNPLVIHLRQKDGCIATSDLVFGKLLPEKLKSSNYTFIKANHKNRTNFYSQNLIKFSSLL